MPTGHLRSGWRSSVRSRWPSDWRPAAAGGSGSATTSKSSGGAQTKGKPLVVGISLSFSGDFSDPGRAAELGYKLWADRSTAGRHPRAQGAAQDRGRRLEPQPGGHELPDADPARQGRPRVRAVLDAAHAPRPPRSRTATATRSPSPRAAARRLPGEARQRLLRAAGAGRQLRRPVRRVHPVAARRASGRRPPPTPSSTTRSPRRSPSAPG